MRAYVEIVVSDALVRAVSSPCSPPRRALRTPSWSSGRTGLIGPRTASTRDPRPARRFPRADRAAVDASGQAGHRRGHSHDGAPGARTGLRPRLLSCSAALLAPGRQQRRGGPRRPRAPCARRPGRPPVVRVRDPQASRRFYTTIAPYAGLRLAHTRRIACSSRTRLVLLARARQRPLTQHVHLAFPADETPRCGHSTPPRRGGLRRTTATPTSGPVRPGLLRRLRARPGRPQRRGRQPQPLIRVLTGCRSGRVIQSR